jgi:hypothetical protein
MTLTPSRISVSQRISEPVQTRFSSTAEDSAGTFAIGALAMIAGAVACLEEMGDAVTGKSPKLKNPRTFQGARAAGFKLLSSSDGDRTRTKYEYD